jgi:hypothetical protein
MAEQTGAQQQDKPKSGVKPLRAPAKRKQLVSIRQGTPDRESTENGAVGSGLFDERPAIRRVPSDRESAEGRAKGGSLFERRAAVRRPSRDGVQHASIPSGDYAELRFGHDFSRVPVQTAAKQTGQIAEGRSTLGVLGDRKEDAHLIASTYLSRPLISRYVSPPTGVRERRSPASYVQYDDATLYGPSEEPSPEHVQQGRMGNCWFLAGLAALASTAGGRSHIKSHIRPNHDGPDGSSETYTVTLYSGLGGSGQHYRMRPAFPEGYASPTPPDRSRPRGGAAAGSGAIVWVSLYERALAHQRGDYSALSGRTGVRSYWAMRVLTGESSGEVEIPEGAEAGDLIDIWRDIWVSIHRYNDPVTAATRSGVHRVSNYRSGHAYAVNRAFTRGGDRYLSIYNPHGLRSRGGDPWQEVPLGDLGRYFATVTLGRLRTGTAERIGMYLGG